MINAGRVGSLYAVLGGVVCDQLGEWGGVFLEFFGAVAAAKMVDLALVDGDVAGVMDFIAGDGADGIVQIDGTGGIDGSRGSVHVVVRVMAGGGVATDESQGGGKEDRDEN